MMKRGAVFTTTMLLLLSASFAHAQDAARLTFDVASIKLSKLETHTGGIKPLPGGHGYTVQNIPVKLMISLMYKVPMRQISGGPDWLDSDRYNIEARADHPYSIDDLHIMFQNLLVDRFGMKFHTESKEGSVYALEIDTPGSKMKINDSPQDFKIPLTYNGDGSVAGVRVPMDYLTWWLGQQLQAEERPVIDHTGLDRNYDFTLSFAPVLPPQVQKDGLPAEVLNRPSLFEAVKQQLGLKLVPQKGPVGYLVIDHIDRPTDN